MVATVLARLQPQVAALAINANQNLDAYAAFGVPVWPDDDEDRLSARILAAEHRLYPMAVRLYAEGRVSVVGDRAVVAGAAAPDGATLNPPEPLDRAGG